MLRTDGEQLPRKPRSGRWLVVGLFLVGTIVVAGFFAGQYWFEHTPKSKWPATQPAK